MHLRAIQGHSGESAVDPALQDNVLLPKGFTEYLCHVGNANELNSIIGNGLILGGKGLKRGRQAVFFTAEDENCMGETPRYSTKTKNRNTQEYLETPSKYNVLMQFEARSRERLAVLPNTVTCSRSLRHTTCSFH